MSNKPKNKNEEVIKEEKTNVTEEKKQENEQNINQDEKVRLLELEIEQLKNVISKLTEKISAFDSDKDKTQEQPPEPENKKDTHLARLKERFSKFKGSVQKRTMSAKKIFEQTNKNSFATGLNFYKLFWVFFIGSFVGVIVEILFCLVTEGHLECRQGVVYGPFNPVYGFGAVVITIVLYILRHQRDLVIFIGGSVIGGAFEWLCSYFQEMFMGTVSWDYSDIPFNIGGRTCLLYSLFWGILAIVWLKFIYPLMSALIERIPNKIGRLVTWVLVLFMAFDMFISSAAVVRMGERQKDIAPKTSFDRFLDNNLDDDFLTQIYPNMRNPESGERLVDKQENKAK
ncbi:MAG: hypothetical protein ACI4IS_07465 [Acutalibacteraceae bacterium]